MRTLSYNDLNYVSGAEDVNWVQLGGSLDIEN